MDSIINKPENGILIIPRIDKVVEGTFVTLVRRLTFANGLIVRKDLLSNDGEWIQVSEGGKYPAECFLRSHFLDRGLSDNLVYNWPPLEKSYRRVNIQIHR